MAHQFDEATAVEAVGDSGRHVFAATTHPAYDNMVGPYGGITAATVIRTILDHPQALGEPLALTLEDLVTEDLRKLLHTLEPTAERLGCLDELAGIADMMAIGASYQRQRRVAATENGALDAVVSSLVDEMRLGRPTS